MNRTEIISFRIDKEVKEKLKKEAKNQHRSMSNLMEKLILDMLDILETNERVLNKINGEK